MQLLQLGVAGIDEYADGASRPDRGLWRGGRRRQSGEAAGRQCPTGKMGAAWDTAHACLHLASDEAGYVNAHDLVVDGGLIAKFV
ncbi:MAG: SDR family oxidoreductase [Alphaproteobacteria bacterium]|nr:SDR family oxidoreductase [Alphaproteobacteria bacterium]